MRKYFTTLSLLAICAAGFGSAAKADVVYVTVTGNVASGSYIDSGGLFGVAGADLTGDAYTAHYTFDTSLGHVVSSPAYNYAYGGSRDGNTSPSLAVDLTINGVTISDVGSYHGEIYGYNDGYLSQSDAVADSNSFQIVNFMYGYPGTSPGLINTSYTIYAADNPLLGGSFADGSLYLDLSPSVYTQYDPSVSNVPEPTSMALLGAGLLGLLVARRRVQ